MNGGEGVCYGEFFLSFYEWTGTQLHRHNGEYLNVYASRQLSIQRLLERIHVLISGQLRLYHLSSSTLKYNT